jgi:hypothetical protein
VHQAIVEASVIAGIVSVVANTGLLEEAWPVLEKNPSFDAAYSY